MAKALAYRPNLAARMLSSRKRLRILVNLPAQTASLWNTVNDGIRSEAGKYFSTTCVGLEFHTFPRHGHGEEEALEQALAAHVDGILASTARPHRLRPLIRKAACTHIPVLAFVSDAPGTEHFATVGIDSLASGALAGELLARFVQGTAKLAMITGDLASPYTKRNSSPSSTRFSPSSLPSQCSSHSKTPKMQTKPANIAVHCLKALRTFVASTSAPPTRSRCFRR
jgi:ABC-type sugar transport system substrate-binding protein